MEIWLYKRETEVSDFVYFDRTTSPRTALNKAKTVVGICVYIDPKDSSHRLCVSLRDIFRGQWGLFPLSWEEGITLSEDPECDVFEIPNLSKRSKFSTITEEMYRNPNECDEQGFTIFDTEHILHEIGWKENTVNMGKYQAGMELPWGLINTLQIVAFRNKILNDPNIDLEVPHESATKTEIEVLNELIEKVVRDNGNKTDYQQFYFPAASACFAYQPEVKPTETLAECFKTGNWFLPSCGELSRLYWYHSQGYENGIFAEAYKAGVMSQFCAENFTYKDFYPSSTQYLSNQNICAISFENGDTYPARYSKSLLLPIRSVCAF